MLDLNRIFSHRPEAAATISGAPGYERLQGQVLFYPASGGTVVVAQLQGLPGDRFFGLHLHQGGACRTVREPFDGAGDHWGLPGQRHPGHLGDLPVLLSENGRAWSAVWTGRFSPVRPGVTPSSSTVWQTTTAPNRQGTPERGSVVASSGSYFSLSRRCR